MTGFLTTATFFNHYVNRNLKHGKQTISIIVFFHPQSYSAKSAAKLKILEFSRINELQFLNENKNTYVSRTHLAFNLQKHK
jgi:hypothetical protein